MFQWRETCCVVTTKDSKIFQKTFEWVKLVKMLVFWERFPVENILWQFMTRNWQDSDVLVHAEKKRHVETMKDPRRKDGFRGNTNIGPVLEVKVTHHLYQYGIEIKVDSMQNDGSQSWIVISRGLNKYVNDLREENGKYTHWEEATASTGRPVATKQKEQFTPSLSSLPTIVVPVDQRKRKTFLPLTTLMGDLFLSMSRWQWPEYFDIEVFIEK